MRTRIASVYGSYFRPRPEPAGFEYSWLGHWFFRDFDNDGWLDLWISYGTPMNSRNTNPSISFAEPNSFCGNRRPQVCGWFLKLRDYEKLRARTRGAAFCGTRRTAISSA